MIVIAWRNTAKGGLSITYPAYNDLGLPSVRDDKKLRETLIASLPSDAKPILLDTSSESVKAFLGDRSQRAAWDHDGKKLILKPENRD